MKLNKLHLLIILFIFTAFTSQASVIILNGLTHIHNTQKGGVVEGSIIMQNMSKIDQRVTIYLNDIEQNCGGKTLYLESDSLPRSLSKWIKFNTTEKVLVPNEKFSLSYTITIPEEFEGEQIDFGSFWGGLMIELAKPINENSQQGVQLNSKIRYCIQLIAHLGEVVSPEIEFENLDFEKRDSSLYSIDMQLKNKGDYMVQPIVILELFDVNGNSVKKSEAVFKKVYPSSCKDFQLILKDIPKGDYDGVLVADYGGEIYGVNLTINID